MAPNQNNNSDNVVEFDGTLEELHRKDKNNVSLQEVFEYLKGNLKVTLHKSQTGFFNNEAWTADVYLKNPETGEVVNIS